MLIGLGCGDTANLNLCVSCLCVGHRPLHILGADNAKKGNQDIRRGCFVVVYLVKVWLLRLLRGFVFLCSAAISVLLVPAL